ncbi:MAG: TetR-like C-terminal domain-containing protein [Acidimicrobiia bacterium]|nr:MAG: TetR-like C-terminal domain-containing protein [Acidimicrobiia bacterium]
MSLSPNAETGDGHGAPRDPGRRPGRPGDADTDRMILDAAYRSLREAGYARMSVEAVAAAAGVGKATLYRLYPDKASLAAAALVVRLAGIEPPRGDDPESLLREMCERFQRALIEGIGLGVIGTLMVEMSRHPELIEAFRTAVTRPRRLLAAEAIKEGRRLGLVRGGVDPDLVVDLLTGPILMRALHSGEVAPGYSARLFEWVWASIRAD